MPYLVRIVVGVALLIAAFIVWRLTSVSRGAKTRDESLLKRLDPLGAKLESGAVVDQREIDALAKAPELRGMLFAMLRHYHRDSMFPAVFMTAEADAESNLAYWLMHPNELQAAPAEMKLLKTVDRDLRGAAVRFFVFKYRMPTGHWAGDKWLLGLAGPFRRGVAPYESSPGGFSRAGDAEGTVSPDELVDWFVGILRQKFGDGP